MEGGVAPFETVLYPWCHLITLYYLAGHLTAAATLAIAFVRSSPTLERLERVWRLVFALPFLCDPVAADDDSRIVQLFHEHADGTHLSKNQMQLYVEYVCSLKLRFALRDQPENVAELLMLYDSMLNREGGSREMPRLNIFKHSADVGKLTPRQFELLSKYISGKAGRYRRVTRFRDVDVILNLYDDIVCREAAKQDVSLESSETLELLDIASDPCFLHPSGAEEHAIVLLTRDEKLSFTARKALVRDAICDWAAKRMLTKDPQKQFRCTYMDRQYGAAWQSGNLPFLS